MKAPTETAKLLPHVVIIGAGFGGLEAAKRLGKVPVRVTLLDRENHHLFQPLLYQVATAGLSANEIASPIRSLVRQFENTSVLLAEVSAIDLERREVRVDWGTIAYDFLVIAAGATTSYFGHDEWTHLAPPMKCLNDALEVRRRVLLAFEQAELETDHARRRELLTFAVVGGGPTGIELAGAIAELAHRALARDFRSIDPTEASITLLEAGPRVLAAFDPVLSQRAVEQLADLGVRTLTGTRVVNLDARGVELAGGRRIAAATVIWAAGVEPVPLVKTVAAERDGRGRINVLPDLSIPGHPEAFAIGDVACVEAPGGGCLPGLAAVAEQEGRAAAESIERTLRGQQRPPFHYRDRGIMATIGRKRAVAQIAGARLSGFVAWLVWLAVHIVLLIGFRNRFVVLFTWFWSYLTYKRGARLITAASHPLPVLAHPREGALGASAGAGPAPAILGARAPALARG